MVETTARVVFTHLNRRKLLMGKGDVGVAPLPPTPLLLITRCNF